MAVALGVTYLLVAIISKYIFIYVRCGAYHGDMLNDIASFHMAATARPAANIACYHILYQHVGKSTA